MRNKLDINTFAPYLKGYLHNGHIRADWIDCKSIKVTQGNNRSPYGYLDFKDGKCIFSDHGAFCIDDNSEEILEDDAIAYQLVSGQKPEFNGGDASGFRKWVEKSIDSVKWYGCGTKEKDLVTVTVTIEKDGTLSNARILQGFCKIPDEEILKTISSSPKWTPAIHEGDTVRVNFVFHLLFPASLQAE